MRVSCRRQHGREYQLAALRQPGEGHQEQAGRQQGPGCGPDRESATAAGARPGRKHRPTTSARYFSDGKPAGPAIARRHEAGPGLDQGPARPADEGPRSGQEGQRRAQEGPPGASRGASHCLHAAGQDGPGADGQDRRGRGRGHDRRHRGVDGIWFCRVQPAQAGAGARGGESKPPLHMQSQWQWQWRRQRIADGGWEHGRLAAVDQGRPRGRPRRRLCRRVPVPRSHLAAIAVLQRGRGRGDGRRGDQQATGDRLDERGDGQAAVRPRGQGGGHTQGLQPRQHAGGVHRPLAGDPEGARLSRERAARAAVQDQGPPVGVGRGADAAGEDVQVKTPRAGSEGQGRGEEGAEDPRARGHPAEGLSEGQGPAGRGPEHQGPEGAAYEAGRRRRQRVRPVEAREGPGGSEAQA